MRSAPAFLEMMIVKGLSLHQRMIATSLTYLIWFPEMKPLQTLKMKPMESLDPGGFDQQMIFHTPLLSGSTTGTSGCWFLIGTFELMLNMFQNVTVAFVKSWSLSQMSLRSQIRFPLVVACLQNRSHCQQFALARTKFNMQQYKLQQLSKFRKISIALWIVT